MKNFGNVDSKFRFVIVAAKRAKAILKGSKPMIKTRSKSAVRIAQKEVRAGLVDFVILKPKSDELLEQDDKVFLGEDVGGIVEEDDVKLPKSLLNEEEEEDEVEAEDSPEEEAAPDLEDKDIDAEVDEDAEEEKEVD